MTKQQKSDLILISVIAALIMFAMPVYAGGDDQTVKVDSIVKGGDNISETIVAGSRGYSVSGSDIDIRDGYRSYAVLWGLYQDSKPNLVTLALQARMDGQHELFATILCDSLSVRKAVTGKRFGKKAKAKCVDVLKYEPPEPPPPPEPSVTESEDDEDDEHPDYDALYARITDLEAETAKAQETARNAVRQAQADTELQEQLDADARRRAKAREALEDNP